MFISEFKGDYSCFWWDSKEIFEWDWYDEVLVGEKYFFKFKNWIILRGISNYF